MLHKKGEAVRVVRIFFYLMILSFGHNHVHAVSKGSDSTLSIEPFYNFSGTPNEMLTFGFFKNGFSLNDVTTSCTFGSIFPVSGNVSLHGGTLYLGTDLIFQNITNLGTLGNIWGNNHAFEMSSGCTGFSAPYNACFKNTNLFLNGDFTFSGTTKFTGNCVIDGRWNNLTLDNGGMLIIGHNSSLRLRNVELGGISGNKIFCMDDGGQLILDNVRWVQNGDYTFTLGSIQIDNEVNFVGPYTFIYNSELTSTINKDSIWNLSEVVRLVIGRKHGVDCREPLYFTDQTAALKMENCTFSVTSSGMSLTRGTVAIDREVTVNIEGLGAVNGLVLGDGTSANDLKVMLFPNAVMRLANGFMVNNMTNANNLSTADVPIKYVQAGNSMVGVKQNVNYSNVSISMIGSGGSMVDPGKQLIYNNVFVNTPFADFTVTATRYNPYTMLFCGDGKIDVSRGTYPLATLVYGINNIFSGVGIVTGPIFVAYPTAALTLAVLGVMNTDITLYGGALTLNADLTFGQNYLIEGAGLVDLGSQKLNLQLQDRVWTSSIAFQGAGARINLESNLDLVAPLVFSGNIYVNGNGSILRLLTGACITVASNSTLHFKNILLDEIAASNICCQDDSAKIILENVTWLQDDDFIFNHGTMSIVGDVYMTGAHVFALQTRFTSTIQDHATLTLDADFTFSCDAVQAVGPMLAFGSAGYSVLSMKGASLHATRFGVQLTKGRILIDGNTQFSAEKMLNADGQIDSTFGIILGDGTADNDCVCEIRQGATVSMNDGYLIYKNAQVSSFKTIAATSVLHMAADTILKLDQSLNIGSGRVRLSPRAIVMRADGISLSGAVEVRD